VRTCVGDVSKVHVAEPFGWTTSAFGTALIGSPWPCDIVTGESEMFTGGVKLPPQAVKARARAIPIDVRTEALPRARDVPEEKAESYAVLFS
jgi:hypothetical protein